MSADHPRAYRVVCQGPHREWYIAKEHADSARDAFEQLRERGFRPRVVYPGDLSRAEEARLLRRCRDIGGAMAKCVLCNYALTGLSPDAATGLLVCPECGAGFSGSMNDAPDPGGEVSPVGHAPGRTYVWVGVILGIFGLFDVYFAAATLILGAMASERSWGRRGTPVIVFGLFGLAVHMVRVLGFLR